MIERNPLFGLGHLWLFETLGKDVDGCQEYDLDIVGIPGLCLNTVANILAVAFIPETPRLIMPRTTFDS